MQTALVRADSLKSVETASVCAGSLCVGRQHLCVQTASVCADTARYADSLCVQTAAVRADSFCACRQPLCVQPAFVRAPVCVLTLLAVLTTSMC